MEKLLHERLREYSHNNFTSVEISGLHLALSRKTAELIADEIKRDYFPRIEIEHCTQKPLSECVAYYTGLQAYDGEAIEDYLNRYYIQRPRYDDGTPMHLGDMCDFGDYFDKDERVKEIFGLHYVNDGEWSIQPLNESYNARLDNCKRPTPKVYDADGVEIKVGKKAWSTSYPLTGGKTVSRVGYSAMRDGHPGQEDAPFVDYAEGGWDYTRNITHERPVFDAQGERICRGDEGWSGLTGNKLAPVVGFTEDKFGMKVELEDGCWIEPINFTHREPDSFEKLRDEIAAWCASNSLATSETRSWSDRLTALIERGA